MWQLKAHPNARFIEIEGSVRSRVVPIKSMRGDYACATVGRNSANTTDAMRTPEEEGTVFNMEALS